MFIKAPIFGASREVFWDKAILTDDNHFQLVADGAARLGSAANDQTCANGQIREAGQG
jgi:hypothetical protein